MNMVQNNGYKVSQKKVEIKSSNHLRDGLIKNQIQKERF